MIALQIGRNILQRFGIHAIGSVNENLNAVHVDGFAGPVSGFQGEDLVFQVFDFLIHSLHLVIGSFYLFIDVFDAFALGSGCDVFQHLLLSGEFIVGSHTGFSGNTAGVAADGLFRNDLADTDFACVVHMTAGAEFLGDIAHGNNAHSVAVLFVKQSGGAGLLRFFNIHDFLSYRISGIDHFVDAGFDFSQLGGSQFFSAGEVKTQVVRAYKASCLVNAIAKHIAQRALQQVGGGVVCGGFSSGFAVYFLVNRITGVDFTFIHHNGKQVLAVAGLDAVFDMSGKAVSFDDAGIGSLTAGLYIEDSVIQNNLAFAFQGIAEMAVGKYSSHGAVPFQMVIAAEGAGFGEVHEIFILGAERVTYIAGSSGAVFLGLHAGVKFFSGYAQTVFLGDFLSHFIGESVGVIQFEHHFSAELSVFCLRHFFIEQSLTVFQGAAESFFLAADQSLVVFLMFLQIGIEILHVVGNHIHQLIQERLIQTDGQAITGSSAQNAAQNIAAAGVGEAGSVRKGKYEGSDVVCDDAEGHFVLSFIFHAGQLFRFMNNGQEQVGIEVGFSVLNQGYQTFETHTGIDIFLGQFLIVFSVQFGIAIILGENNVPDFYITVIFHFLEEQLFAQSFRIVFFTAVEVNFGVRSAGSLADFPEVFLCSQDMGRINVADFGPDSVGFIIIGVDGDVKFILINAHPLFAGQEFPGKGNGFFFEVVTNGEVAQHFKEGMVSGCFADIFNIVGSNGFLRIGNAVLFWFFRTVKVLFQAGYTGVDPQQSGIVMGNQAYTGFDHVVLGSKIIQEHLPDLITG